MLGGHKRSGIAKAISV